MFITEFEVRNLFLFYALALIIVSTAVLRKNDWTFKAKLLRLLLIFFVPVLGLLVVVYGFLLDALTAKKV
ncbi:MAG: hypothetical protein KKG00_02490 [Bacteroidetes bacterium]|nr:hypothetical protein [Bacteroidota bacterium]